MAAVSRTLSDEGGGQSEGQRRTSATGVSLNTLPGPWPSCALRLDRVCLARNARPLAGRAGRRRVADQMVNVILQPGSTHFKLFDLLIGRKINFFLDAVNRVVQSVIFIEHLT